MLITLHTAHKSRPSYSDIVCMACTNLYLWLWRNVLLINRNVISKLHYNQNHQAAIHSWRIGIGSMIICTARLSMVIMGLNDKMWHKWILFMINSIHVTSQAENNNYQSSTLRFLLAGLSSSFSSLSFDLFSSFLGVSFFGDFENHFIRVFCLLDTFWLQVS